MMLNDPDACYQALLSRDGRFDGRFYVGVSSTGIYCRPVCRVRTPKPENCRYFPSATAAEAAGFRPCLRCRPEQAPGRAPIDATARLVQAAVGLVEERLDAAWTVESLAARVGVTPRHLRRLFEATFGLAPSAYLARRRIQVARQLLAASELPIGEVALAAGFRSLRCFNQSFRTHCGMPPGQIRRSPVDADGSGSFPLAWRAPYDWDAMCGFLGRRAIPLVEAVVHDGARPGYRRVVGLRDDQGNGPTGWVSVTPGDHGLTVRISAALLPRFPAVLARLRRLFDLDCDPQEVGAVLGSVAARRPGLRLPGSVDGFETSVRAILGQQVSVQAARTLATRLVERFGGAIDTPWPDLRRAFPPPAVLAAQPAEALAALGILPARARAIIGLAGAVERGDLMLVPNADVGATRAALLALPGIGPWTAEYILMRALSWPDAFPEGDVGIHKALGIDKRAEVARRAEDWRPWRAYAVIHLWQHLEDGHEP
ncbi:MAG: helix-turn-helix domain-containing protein [Rhodocyclaceae bacterium]|nr:helix-turn-helix domain-containing protein [Rhodocyclaceae bacterium]